MTKETANLEWLLRVRGAEASEEEVEAMKSAIAEAQKNKFSNVISAGLTIAAKQQVQKKQEGGQDGDDDEEADNDEEHEDAT